MNTAGTVVAQINPFPGLRPFREDEEYLFFGRESQVDAMVNTLATTHFLAVVGASGSGKSSLVNCGLRPALHRGLLARAGTVWRMAQFRPGGDPLGALARALAGDGVLFRGYEAGGLTLTELIDTTLRMSKLGLIDICEQARLGEGVNLLVVVDQFEELFRYRQLGVSQNEHAYGVSAEATAFMNILLEVQEQTSCPIYVVLTMRSDFLGDCAQFPGLPEAINAGQYLVPRLTRDERRAAISGPVGVGGAKIAPVLLTRLVNDVGDNPDQLSILQHALNRTWARWQHEGSKGPLDLPHYDAIGTMAHALDQHAENAYAELGVGRQQQICEKLFKALTDKATDPRGVRRPTTLGTLCALAAATAAEVTEVIDVFREPSRSFLMPPAGEALTAETVIDISHESLMRVWQRLNIWADKEAQSARIYRRLAETSDLHDAGRAGLWDDPDLQLTLQWREDDQPNEEWARRYHPEFASAMRFLDKSKAARERRRWTRVGLTLGVIAVLVVLLGYAMFQAREAGERAITAEVMLRWTPFDLTSGLNEREVEGLFTLARDDKKVKQAFIKQLKDDDALAEKFSTQPKAIARALVGLDTAARDWLIKDLLPQPIRTEAKPAVRIALGFLAAELEAADGSPYLLKAIQDTTNPSQLQALGRALAALVAKLPPAQAEPVVDHLLKDIQDATNLSQPDVLGQALAALVAKLPPVQAEPVVAHLLKAIQDTTNPSQLQALGQALAALPGELPPAQAEPVVAHLLKAIQATTNPSQLQALGQALAALPGELPPAQAEPVVAHLLKAIQATAHPSELSDELGPALTALVAKLPGDQVSAAFAFEILKYPNFTTEDILLEAVRTRFKDREPPPKEKGFWAMVEWADKQFPNLDLKSPPKVASKESKDVI